MFKRLPESTTSAGAAGAAVRLTIDGHPIEARLGDSVAAALIAAGREVCRTTPVSGAARAPYCLMGVCFECLVMIDGVGNRQGCLTPVREGMRVQTQQGKRSMAEGLEDPSRTDTEGNA